MNLSAGDLRSVRESVEAKVKEQMAIFGGELSRFMEKYHLSDSDMAAVLQVDLDTFLGYKTSSSLPPREIIDRVPMTFSFLPEASGMHVQIDDALMLVISAGYLPNGFSKPILDDPGLYHILDMVAEMRYEIDTQTGPVSYSWTVVSTYTKG